MSAAQNHSTEKKTKRIDSHKSPEDAGYHGNAVTITPGTGAPVDGLAISY